MSRNVPGTKSAEAGRASERSQQPRQLQKHKQGERTIDPLLARRDLALGEGHANEAVVHVLVVHKVDLVAAHSQKTDRKSEPWTGWERQGD